MRISDWSSDVCSSDLITEVAEDAAGQIARRRQQRPARSEAFQRIGLDLRRRHGQRRDLHELALGNEVGETVAGQPVADALPGRRGRGIRRLEGIDLDLGAQLDVEAGMRGIDGQMRSEEHTSELQSLMRISYAVFGLKNKNKHIL